ncbi:MAG TPA: hypothetical protein VEG68_12465, partial [Terriglobales bacterium]|nr:hypothetical protein [Terriglobales bacterium]
IIASLMLATATDGTPSLLQKEQTNCTAVSERDARILVYLIPAAFDLRAKGRDVVLDRQTGSEQNELNKYVFQLDASPQNRFGSSLVGYFDVDRCTGEIRDDATGDVITSDALRGVQKIITQTKP